MKTLFRVFAYVRSYPWMAAGTLLCAVLSTLMVTVFPKVTQLLIDEVRAGRRENLMLYSGIALAAFFLRDLLNGLRIILNNTFEQKVIFDLRSDLYSHIQQLPLTWFDNWATGDIMTRILEDVNSVERVLIDGIEQGVVSVLQIIAVGAILFFYSAKLALLCLVPIPFLVAGALLYTTTAHARYRTRSRASSAMNSLLHDNLAGIRQIKTYVRETEEHARFNAVSQKLREATLTVMRVWALYSPSMAFFNSLGLVLVIGFGGQAVIDGQMSVGDLVGFLLLAGFLYEPIGRLHSLNQLVQSGRAAGERVFEIMDEKAEPGHSGEVEEAVRIEGDVRFKNVSFAYDDAMPVLHDLTLHARPGETVALVGHTGAGKSTLVNLITRFYEFDSGEIVIDGRPLRGIPKSALRNAVGLVTQESFLFNGTIRDNLRLGNPDAAEEELWGALESAKRARFRGAPS
jgi:ABC-type multidrug transport system fused ATPase/permease subunit